MHTEKSIYEMPMRKDAML